MKFFTYGITAGFAATILAVILPFAILALIWPDRLPAPAISRLAVTDEKLRFLRNNSELNPHIIAVGSSIAWRQLSGAEIEQAGRVTFLNGGMVHLKTHQTREIAQFYLDRYPGAGELLVPVSLPDFENCTDAPSVFDSEDAVRYAFGGWPAAYFYLRYFDLRRYVRLAQTLPSIRTPSTGEFYLDAYGSGPVQLPPEAKRGLQYGDLRADPSCSDALVGLSHDAARRGVQVVIAFPPIHPDYLRLYPEAARTMAAIVAEMREKTSADGAKIIDLSSDPRFGVADFWDAFHLQWSAAGRLSQLIADAIYKRDDKQDHEHRVIARSAFSRAQTSQCSVLRRSG